MPSSTACLKKGPASSSLKDHSLNPYSSPKLMQPSAIRLTFKPELRDGCTPSLIFLRPVGPALEALGINMSGSEQHLDGAPLVHSLVCLSDLIERQL